MNWHKVTITAKEATQGRHAKIQDDFVQIFMKLGGNKELALLESGYNSDGTFNIYFTPKCYDVPALKVLIDSNDGVECEEPSDKEVGFAAGVAGVWEHLIRSRNI